MARSISIIPNVSHSFIDYHVSETEYQSANPPTPVEASNTDCVLAPLFRIPASIRLYHRCLDVQARYGYAFYDALIVAAALDAGCALLYSEDLQDGQRIDGLTIENPFKG